MAPRGTSVLRGGLVILAAMAACGGSDDRDSNDERELRALANGARSDLLAGRTRGFCSRLTDHGRRRALAFRVDFDDPPPPNCEQVVRRELTAAADPKVDVTWTRQLREVTPRVGDIEASSARIDLVLRGRTVATVTAAKGISGWRLDDSNVVPAGR
jgi:hypothetical protein